MAKREQGPQTIIRVNKSENPYAQVARAALEDDRIGWKAKGLLAYLLSRPNDWEVYTAQLVKVGPDGRDATKAALRELIEAGYVVRQELRARGRFSGYVYLVHEAPVDVAPAASTGDGKAVAGETGDGKTGAGKPPTTKKDSTQKDETKKDSHSGEDAAGVLDAEGKGEEEAERQAAARASARQAAKDAPSEEAVAVARSIYSRMELDGMLRLEDSSGWTSVAERWSRDVARTMALGYTGQGVLAAFAAVRADAWYYRERRHFTGPAKFYAVKAPEGVPYVEWFLGRPGGEAFDPDRKMTEEEARAACELHGWTFEPRPLDGHRSTADVRAVGYAEGSASVRLYRLVNPALVAQARQMADVDRRQAGAASGAGR